MSSSEETLYYHHGRFNVSGGVIPDAITAYRTYGDPKNPCIVFPTCYGGKLDSQDYMVGKGKCLDPAKYFVVTFALFSNGEVCGQSLFPPPYNGPYFPAVSYEDNIRAQYIVLTKHLGIQHVYCVVGFSMGGQQAYHWPVMYPDYIDKYIPICGSARTSPHNKAFLEGPKAALVASKDFDDGHYKSTPQHGIRAFGRAYCAWAYGQTWFREHGYLNNGSYPDLQTFMREEWEGGFLTGWDANDLLTLLHTWRDGDVSKINDGGDLAKCLGKIKAKGLIMPCKTDLYFPPEDGEFEVSCMPNTATLFVIPSVWGHMAGGASNVKDDDLIQSEVTKFLEAAVKTQLYHHGRFPVSGGIIPDGVTAFRTYGDPKNPCIVFPTCYGAKLDSQEYLVGEGKCLDPSKYFIVTFALFSNGESSSPSNTPAPYNGPYFPAVSYVDNIRAQYAVLTKKLGIQHILCVVGFSMGGQQAYHWPVMYPDFVDKYVAICTSARTSPHNIAFLEGPKAALVASKDFDDGHYKSTPQHGIRAFGRVYCAWAYGQTWFREHKYLGAGIYPDLPSFMRERWEGGYLLNWDANDMLTLLHTWQAGDVSKIRDGGDLTKCLKAIKAKGLIMPCKTDLYFAPEDSEYEVSCMPDTARLVIIQSVWGHVAGGSSNPEDVAFVQSEINKFLAE
ncbi:hypothetical protein JAAARDRAFT_58074 [Jaapia argillacea MUCL 33604]|uniref:AB hydrolase-1 domain-containing protein n=1 Tax=Jaapia argillacea MUCL 33604 TaxID=933084 RepID=A0A067Q1W3_9AGAM|nr:hypothetical protein JAAARDRAFT_58074 [Jaapia argillacea MUCL 33604]